MVFNIRRLFPLSLQRSGTESYGSIVNNNMFSVQNEEYLICGGSGFPFSLSEWSLTICLTPYNRR